MPAPYLTRYIRTERPGLPALYWRQWVLVDPLRWGVRHPTTARTYLRARKAGRWCLTERMWATRLASLFAASTPEEALQHE